MQFGIAVKFCKIYKIQQNPEKSGFYRGAEKGIRTLDTVPRIHDFQSCALDQLSHLCTAYLSYNTFPKNASVFLKKFYLKRKI